MANEKMFVSTSRRPFPDNRLRTKSGFVKDFNYPLHLQPAKQAGVGFNVKSASRRSLHDLRARQAILPPAVLFPPRKRTSLDFHLAQFMWMGKGHVRFIDLRQRRRQSRTIMNVKFGPKTRPC